MRGAAFVIAPNRIELNQVGRLNNQLIHVTDWYPTFARLASGGNQEQAEYVGDDYPLTGVDAWDTIAHNGLAKRDEILHNIDPITGQMAARVGHLKIFSGVKGARWYPPANVSAHWAEDTSTNFGTYICTVLSNPVV